MFPQCLQFVSFPWYRIAFPFAFHSRSGVVSLSFRVVTMSIPAMLRSRFFCGPFAYIIVQLMHCCHSCPFIIDLMSVSILFSSRNIVFRVCFVPVSVSSVFDLRIDSIGISRCSTAFPSCMIPGSLFVWADRFNGVASVHHLFNSIHSCFIHLYVRPEVVSC